MTERQLFIGCAGWIIPASEGTAFPEQGSHLERYAARFSAVEINSSFYRPHLAKTYARWAETVHHDFRFSVKMPRAITHESKLAPERQVLEKFVSECSHLGPKLGCVLVQVPPSLSWEAGIAAPFFKMLRDLIDAPIACEPRHRSWFSAEVDGLLSAFRVSRVVADPCLVNGGELPGGWKSFTYYRLHGSPRVYYSNYDSAYLAQFADRIRRNLAAGHSCWCIFDNTAAGAASRNALELQTYFETNSVFAAASTQTSLNTGDFST